MSQELRYQEIEGEIAIGPAMWETNNKIILTSDDDIISNDKADGKEVEGEIAIGPAMWRVPSL